jgi:hypothetical protein
MTLHICPCGGQVEAGGKAPAGGGECLACGRVFDDPAALVAAGGSWAIVCSRGGRRSSRKAELCEMDGCTDPMVALCDEPTGLPLGRLRRTCDKRLCARHRTRVGPNRDRCPAHAPQQDLLHAR